MAKGIQEALKTTYMEEEEKKALVNRLNRACGQIQALKGLIEKGECVDRLLIQLAAARSALTQAALVLAERHMARCVTHCMPGSREETLRRVTRALAAVIRNS